MHAFETQYLHRKLSFSLSLSSIGLLLHLRSHHYPIGLSFSPKIHPSQILSRYRDSPQRESLGLDQL